MESNNLVTMSVSSWTNYVDDENIEIAIGKVEFLSNKPNSHRHIYSEDIIKRDASTVLGKFVVAKYDKWENDAQGHNKDEVIVGYVPQSQEISYKYDVEGYLVASCEVVISKLYATEIYELFKRKNYKSVSIEELVNFTEETQDIIDGMADKIVDGFNITGITILGDKYNPSVPNANITLTRMSEDSIEELEKEYVKYSHRDFDKLDIVLSKLESIEEKLNKENNMADLENKEVVENSEVELEVNATIEEPIENACGEDDKVENACEEEKVEEAEVDNGCGCEETEVENSCGEEKVENAEEDAEEEKDDEAKAEDEKMSTEIMSELESKLSEAEATIASQEAELSELREFKQSVENSEKEIIANQTLAKIKSFITDEEYAEYIGQFDACAYAEVNGLRNSILAKYFDQIESMLSQNKTVEAEIEDLGVPSEPTKYNSIYD